MTVREEILAFLTANPRKHSSREIQRALDKPVSLASIQRNLQALHDAHEIARHGGKRGLGITYEAMTKEEAIS